MGGHFIPGHTHLRSTPKNADRMHVFISLWVSSWIFDTWRSNKHVSRSNMPPMSVWVINGFSLWNRHMAPRSASVSCRFRGIVYTDQIDGEVKQGRGDLERWSTRVRVGQCRLQWFWSPSLCPTTLSRADGLALNPNMFDAMSVQLAKMSYGMMGMHVAEQWRTDGIILQARAEVRWNRVSRRLVGRESQWLTLLT